MKRALLSVVVLGLFASTSFAQTAQNLALNKTATQSSEFGNNASPALLAVDRYKEGKFSVGFVTSSANNRISSLNYFGTGAIFSNIPEFGISFGRNEKETNDGVLVNFANYTKHEISVYWVNNNTEKRHLTIDKDQKTGQATYANHVWRIKIGSRVVGTYKATGAYSQLVEIVSTDVDAGRISNKEEAQQKCDDLASQSNQIWSGKWEKSSSNCELIKLNTRTIDLEKPAPPPPPPAAPVGSCYGGSPGPEIVVIFAEANYLGDCYHIKYLGRDQSPWRYSIEWTYKERKFFRIGNRGFNSINIGSGVVVTICTRKNLSGTCKEFTESVADLNAAGIPANSINSFKIYTLTPKNYVSRNTPTATQVRICNTDKSNAIGCLTIGIGDRALQGREFNEIEVGAGVKAQIYPESGFYGTSTLYPGGVKQKTPKFRSIRVLAIEDTLRADRFRKGIPVPVSPAANVDPPVVPAQVVKATGQNANVAKTNNPSNTTSDNLPVVMPAKNSSLYLVNFSLSQSSIDQAYVRPKQEGNLDAGYGSPAGGSPIRSEYFDFALNKQGELFYMKSRFNSYNFASDLNKEISRLIFSSPSKLVKIAGTDLSLYRQNGKARYNTNLYGLTQDGRIVKASFDSSSNPPSRISFNILNSNNRFSDIYYQDGWQRLVALTSGSTLLAYSEGKWTELTNTNFVRFAPDDFNGKIFGLTANNELFVADKDGKRPVKILDDVKDFSVARGGLVYHISSKTNLLMKTRLDFGLGGNFKEVIATEKADEKGTFVKFITKTQCVVQNGNGQVFLCQ